MDWCRRHRIPMHQQWNVLLSWTGPLICGLGCWDFIAGVPVSWLGFSGLASDWLGGTSTSRSEALLRNPGWLAWIIIWGDFVIWVPGGMSGISWNIFAMYTNYKCCLLYVVNWLLWIHGFVRGRCCPSACVLKFRLSCSDQLARFIWCFVVLLWQ